MGVQAGQITNVSFRLILQKQWTHFSFSLSPRTLQSVRWHSAILFDGHYNWHVGKHPVIHLLLSSITNDWIWLLIHEVSRSHTQRRTTVGRTPLDEWSARRRDLYLTTLTTDKRSMPPVGFEPTSPAGERPQTYVLDRAATGTGIHFSCASFR